MNYLTSYCHLMLRETTGRLFDWRYLARTNRLFEFSALAQVCAGSSPISLGTDRLTEKYVPQNGKPSDAKGGSSTATIGDVNQSNGVIHVVDTVLMPNVRRQII